MKPKFRAWDKQDQRMIYDEQEFIPLRVTNVGVFRLDPHHEKNFWIIQDVKRFDLMQSTGLHDKNGKEIFGGDMVTDFSFVNDIGVPYKAEIYFGDGAFRMKGNCDCIGCNGNRKVLNLAESSELEIIGNIWESEK